jgi:hypothetical protein
VPPFRREAYRREVHGARQISKVEQTLVALRLIADYEPSLAMVRECTETLKSIMLRWITPAAILASLVCAWIATSQVSLMAHAWT